MSLKSLARAWNEFFFAPQSPTPVCLYRILFGLLALADFILLRPDWLAWFGTRGIISLETMQHFEPGTRINLFAIAPNDFWVEAIFWIALVSAFCLTVGFLTRASSIAVFICLTSINQRALFAMNAGDSLLRVTGFWLMFAPAGAAFSVDRLLRLWRGKEGLEIQPRAPWAQRMIQYETALLYVATFWLKSQGPSWIDGTALYYVYHLEQFQRFPVPSFLQDLAIVKLETWATLALEFSLGVLIWFKELRYPLLLPLFQWIILATYVNFIDPADLARAGEWIRARLPVRSAAPVTVVYDAASDRVVRTANVLRAMDFRHRMQLVDLQAAAARHGVGEQEGAGRLLVATPGGWRHGFEAIRYLLLGSSRGDLTAARAAK
jgi:hypothetical protein